MDSTRTFDIIVIGAGSGGLNIAGFMNKAGFRVLLIDKSDAHIGGDCLNFGCVPSKALIHVARMVHHSKESSAFGMTVSGAADWARVTDYIKEKQNIIRAHESAEWFRAQGMTVVLGHAEFASPNSVMVDGVEYSGKRMVIATGSRPREIVGKGIEQVASVLNNENIFSMKTLPKRLLVVGGGPIGIEIAQSLSFLGSDVTVAVQDKHILSKEDPELSGALMSKMREGSVNFIMESKLDAFVSPNEARFTLDNGASAMVEFDSVFIGIGRVLNTEGLSLEKAGVRTEPSGAIVVNKYLETTNKNVYLCGDVAGNFQFTHAAEMHAGVIIRNFFSPIKKPFSGDHISWTTFTTPEIATFGLGELELKKRKTNYEVLATDFQDDDRAITDDYQYGKSKIFISKKGKILGGTMVAPNAGELVQELVLAQRLNLGLGDLFSKTYAYPTATRINKRTSSVFFGKKLSVWSKKLLHLLY